MICMYPYVEVNTTDMYDTCTEYGHTRDTAHWQS